MFLEAHRLALFNERGLEVDVILDLMIHDIDIALHIIQSPLHTIRAAGVAVLTQLPDIASVRLEFANGAVANLTASRMSLKNMRKLRSFRKTAIFRQITPTRGLTRSIRRRNPMTQGIRSFRSKSSKSRKRTLWRKKSALF